MKLDVQTIKDLGFQLQEEGQEVLRIVKEKGVKHYQQPLLLAVASILGCYFLVYSATGRKLDRLQNQIQAEKDRAKHAETYEALRAKMQSYYARMARPEVKDGWLFNKVLESATGQKIILDAISSQSETGNSETYLLTIPVSAHLTFAQLGKWIESLENQRPALFVNRLSVKPQERTQRSEDFGTHVVELEIATVIPKKVQRL